MDARANPRLDPACLERCCPARLADACGPVFLHIAIRDSLVPRKKSKTSKQIGTYVASWLLGS